MRGFQYYTLLQRLLKCAVFVNVAALTGDA
jgi:hypothetical protein